MLGNKTSIFGYKPAFGAALALALFAFAGAGVTYVNLVFTPATRWLTLLILLFILVLNGRIFILFNRKRVLPIIFFLGYALASMIWSEVIDLSLTKSLAYSVSVLAFGSAGAFWAQRCNERNALRILWPLAMLVLISSAFGSALDSAVVKMNESALLYRGLTGNSNYLGMLCLAVLPLGLWEFHSRDRRGVKKYASILLLIGIFLLLITTQSRASMLGAAVVCIAFLWGARLERYFIFLVIMTFGALLMPLILPEFTESLINRYVYKGAGENLLHTREAAWALSFDAAQAGGLYGLGFGVAYGETNFNVGFSIGGYGREKGNTLLAIAEELGLIGVVLYLLLVGSVLLRIFSVAAIMNHPNRRILLAICGGAIAGFVVNSQFESWWLGPGAALTPVFWGMVGIGLALADRFKSLQQLETRLSCDPVGGDLTDPTQFGPAEGRLR